MAKTKIALRILAIALTCAITLSGISCPAYAITDPGDSTLAPPLATQLRNNTLLHNEWIVVEIGRLVYPILKLAQEGKLQNPIAILIPHIKKNIDVTEISLEGFNIDGIEELRAGESVTGFALPVTKNGSPAYRLVYNLQSGATAIQMRDGKNVYVNIENAAYAQEAYINGLRVRFLYSIDEATAERSRAAYEYSLFKMGDPQAIRSEALNLAHQIEKDLLLSGDRLAPRKNGLWFILGVSASLPLRLSWRTL